MTNFTYYDAKVRIGNNTLFEVLKQGVTAAEIEVLKAIHGDTAVSVVSLSGMAPTYTAIDDNGAVRPIKHTPAYERSRLQELYGPALAKPPSATTVKDMFRGTLPVALEEAVLNPVQFADEVEFADENTAAEPAEELI